MRKAIVIGGIIFCFLIVGTWFFFFRKGNRSVVFETARPSVGNISETVTATGTIQIVDTVAVGTQVSGIIKSLYADYNSVVKKGQLLAEIDPTLLQATADQITANLASAKSNLDYQQGNFDRQKQLYQVGAISKADYLNALNGYDMSKANVASFQAQLHSALRNLDYTKIYSPWDGIVLTRNVSLGQTVTASLSTPTLFVIAKDISKMQVNASVDEADIGQVGIGQKASFTVNTYPNEVYYGKVSKIRLEPITSANVVTYTTLIDVDNSKLKLKPGMTATITIFSKEANNVMLIPVSATKFAPDMNDTREKYLPLKKNAAKNSVWVLKGDSLVQKKIQTGLNDNNNIQIVGGLTIADAVVTASEPLSQKQVTNQPESPFIPRRPSQNRRN